MKTPEKTPEKMPDRKRSEPTDFHHSSAKTRKTALHLKGDELDAFLAKQDQIEKDKISREELEKKSSRKLDAISRSITKEENIGFKLTPRGKNLVSPPRTAHKGNERGRHISPYKLLTKFVKSNHYRFCQYNGIGAVDYQSFEKEVINTLSKILTKDSLEELSGSIKKNSQGRSIAKKTEELKKIELVENYIREALRDYGENDKLRSAIDTQKELADGKQKEITREYVEKISDSINSLVQSIEGLAYISNIRFTSSHYLREAVIVKNSLNNLEKEDLIKEEILSNMVKTLDLPAVSLFKPKSKKASQQSFEKEDMFRFLSLHLFLCKETFQCVNKYFQKNENCKEGENEYSQYQSFVKAFIYQAVAKSGWIGILSDNSLDDNQRQYKESQERIYKELQSTTSEREVTRLIKKLDDLNIPKASTKQLKYLFEEFSKYAVNENGSFSFTEESKLTSCAKSVDKKLDFDLLLSPPIPPSSSLSPTSSSPAAISKTNQHKK